MGLKGLNALGITEHFVLGNQPNYKLKLGCGSVGRAVASNTRVAWFKSSLRPKKIIFILNICLLSTVYSKDENKEKEAGMAH